MSQSLMAQAEPRDDSDANKYYSDFTSALERFVKDHPRLAQTRVARGQRRRQGATAATPHIPAEYGAQHADEILNNNSFNDRGDGRGTTLTEFIAATGAQRPEIYDPPDKIPGLAEFVVDTQREAFVKYEDNTCNTKYYDSIDYGKHEDYEDTNSMFYDNDDPNINDAYYGSGNYVDTDSGSGSDDYGCTNVTLQNFVVNTPDFRKRGEYSYGGGDDGEYSYGGGRASEMAEEECERKTFKLLRKDNTGPRVPMESSILGYVIDPGLRSTRGKKFSVNT